MRSADTKTAILDAAQDVLITLGGAQLTMRKVADRAGVSLGNLQYHFANRDALLTALLSRFLDDYERTLETRAFAPTGDLRADLKVFFVAALNDPGASVCAAVFTELWAASRQHADMKHALDAYYKRLALFYKDLLTRLLGAEASDAAVEQAVSVILPLLEGYCVTKGAAVRSMEATAEGWAQIVGSVLQGSGNLTR